MTHDSESICCCKHCLNDTPRPSFRKWSLAQLRAEAKRLGLPRFEQQSKAELIENLTEAWA